MRSKATRKLSNVGLFALLLFCLDDAEAQKQKEVFAAQFKVESELIQEFTRNKSEKALVFITDVMEKNSGTDFKKAAKALENGDVELYILTLPYSGEDRSSQLKKLTKNKEMMIRLADDSGGEAFFPESLDAMKLPWSIF